MEKGTIRNQLWSTIVFLSLFSLLFGLCYPGLMTLILQTAFNEKANGSLYIANGQVRGSWLLGQHFTQEQYFWGRPSISPIPYQSIVSGGSNLSTTNQLQLALVKSRVDSLRQKNPLQTALIPIDLVTASASGLDPDISIASALYQVPRIAKARSIDEKEIVALISKQCPGMLTGLLGTAHVNVLKLNVALDKVNQEHHGDAKT